MGERAGGGGDGEHVVASQLAAEVNAGQRDDRRGRAVVDLVLGRKADCYRLGRNRRQSRGKGDRVVAVVIAGHRVARVDRHRPGADPAFREPRRRQGHRQDIAGDQVREGEAVDRSRPGAVIDLVGRRERHLARTRRDLGGHLGERQGVVAVVIAGHRVARIDCHRPPPHPAFRKLGRGRRQNRQSVAGDDAGEDEVMHDRGGVAVIGLVGRRERHGHRLRRDRRGHVGGEADLVVAIVIAGNDAVGRIHGHIPSSDPFLG